MAPKIEPSEVLAHLNRMGFCGVTAEQLREFISDLKKLMKYDLQQCSCNREQCTDEYLEFAAGLSADCSREIGRHGDALDDNEIDNSNTSSAEQLEVTEGSSYTRGGNSACSSTAGFNGQPSGTQWKKCSDAKSSQQCKREPQRPRSSFIKSRQLLGQLAPRRSDPVALYHKYQTMWQRQKVPGDDAHVGLRWTIREKMLGVDPHPRPVSRASSVDRFGRHHRPSVQWNVT